MLTSSFREAIFAYVRETYETEPEYPWAAIPEGAVLRHRENRKWYGLLMPVGREKLGLEGDGSVDLLNFKCDGALNGAMRREPGFFPGYHMNKEHWISVLLDGTVPLAEILPLLDLSYTLTAPKRRWPKAAKHEE